MSGGYTSLHGSSSAPLNLSDTSTSDGDDASDNELVFDSSSDSFELEERPVRDARQPQQRRVHFDPMVDAGSEVEMMPFPTRRPQRTGRAQTTPHVQAPPVPPGARRADAGLPLELASHNTKKASGLHEPVPSRERPASAGRQIGRSAAASAPSSDTDKATDTSTAAVELEDVHFQAAFNPVPSRSPQMGPLASAEDEFIDVEDDMGEEAFPTLDSSPPRYVRDDALSNSLRSVKYRVDQHEDYHAAATGNSTLRSRQTHGSNDEEHTAPIAEDVEEDKPAQHQPHAASESLLHRFLRSLRNNPIGERLAVVEKTMLQFGTVALLVMVLGGFTALGVGIWQLSLFNSREKRVSEYNDAVGRFDAPAGGAAFVRSLAAKASINGQEHVLTQHTASIHAVGKSEGVASATTVFVEGDFAVPSSESVRVAFTIDAGERSPISFSRELLTTVSADDDPPGYAISEMSSNGLGDRYYLSEVCVVVKEDDDGSVTVSDLESCYFSFGPWQRYAPNGAGRAKLRVRIDRDPFIVLQRVTQGTESFDGVTRYEQNVRGGVSVAFGILAIILFGFCLIHGAGELFMRHRRLRLARKGMSWNRDAVRRVPKANAPHEPKARRNRPLRNRARRAQM